jgi:hypothetical protein
VISRSTRLYGYAVVGRYGLGHSLLAWARCWAWCNQHGVPMLAPNWNHLRIGPRLRKERDRRQYQRYFQFGGYVTGLKRAWLLSTLRWLPAETTDMGQIAGQGVSGLVVFRNLVSMNEEIHFHEVVGRGPTICRALRSMTRARFVPEPAGRPYVAVHVRMGDFVPTTSEDELKMGAKNRRVPLCWYIDILQGLRRRVGDVPSVIYSDGPDSSFKALLELPHVRRAPQVPAITDLLAISQAGLVISSGSGFSMWGSFLGNVPRVCFPGQRFVRVLGEPDGWDREPEVQTANELGEDFVEHVAARLATRQEA